MKKRVLYFFIVLFIAGPAAAQIPLVGYITTNGPAKYPTHIDSLGYGGFRVVKDTAERNAITTQRRKYGMAVYVQSSDSLYILRDQSLGNANWFAFAPSGGSDLSAYLKTNDTATMLSPYLLNAFGLKYSDTAAMLSGYEKAGVTLKISDTAAMLSGYVKSSQSLTLSDTANMLAGYARAGQTLQLSDTASMLSNLLKISDTSNMLSGYARAGSTLTLSDTASMLSNLLKISDTSNMLSGYARAGSTLTLSDTAGMLSGYERTGRTLQLSDTASMLQNLLKISDTANMLSGYARAGQYLKSSDTASLLSGVLHLADTAAMLSGYAKAGETLRLGDTASLLSNTLKTSDTAQMLSNLLRISDTSNMLSSRLRIADTANMLSAYAKTADVLKISDTASMLVNYTREGMVVKYSDTAAMFAAYRQTALAADTFTSNITVYSTQGLGKYSQGQTIPAVGKTAMAVLIDALTQTISPNYVQPTVGISASPSGGTFEIGSALNVTLTALFTQNDAGAKTTESFSKGGVPLGGNTDNIASLTAPVSYTATVSYGQGGVKNNNLGTPDPTGQIAAGSKTSSSVTFTPQSKRYWGYVNTSSPTDADILAVLGGNSELSSSKAKSSFDITISGGARYIVFAYPASLGTLSGLSVGGFGSLSSFTLITRSFTNANGYSQSYNIYVSQNDFSTTVSGIITN